MSNNTFGMEAPKPAPKPAAKATAAAPVRQATVTRLTPAPAKAEPAAAKKDDVIKIDEFFRVELRVAKILEAEPDEPTEADTLSEVMESVDQASVFVKETEDADRQPVLDNLRRIPPRIGGRQQFSRSTLVSVDRWGMLAR